MSNLLSATMVELTPLAKGVFGEAQIHEMKKKGLKNVRKIWELSTPTTQCLNTIGPCIADSCTCYICGFPIQTDKNMDVDDDDDEDDDDEVGEAEEFYPECEHVLPIAQAMIFLDLYIGSYKSSGTITDAQKAALELEYRWAHKVCNRAKTDISFITTQNDRWVPNVTVIEDLLRNIYKKSKKIKAIVINRDKENWITERLKLIRHHIDQIIAHILNRDDNSNDIRGESQYQNQNLVLLAGIASLFDVDHQSAIVKKIIPEVIARYKTLAFPSLVNFNNEFTKIITTIRGMLQLTKNILDDRVKELTKKGIQRKYSEFYARTFKKIQSEYIENVSDNYAKSIFLKLINSVHIQNKNNILPFITEITQCYIYFKILEENVDKPNDLKDSVFIKSKIYEIFDLWIIRPDRITMINNIDNSSIKTEFEQYRITAQNNDQVIPANKKHTVVKVRKQTIKKNILNKKGKTSSTKKNTNNNKSQQSAARGMSKSAARGMSKSAARGMSKSAARGMSKSAARGMSKSAARGGV
jgi:hypothetical protein